MARRPSSATAEQPPVFRPFPEIRHAKKRAFLMAYSEYGHIGKASTVAGMDRRNHALWMKKDPVYAEAFAIAEEVAIEALEAEADRRGMLGVERPVYQGGRMVGTTTEYSDTLLIFRLKALKPDKYRDRFSVHADVTHHNGDSQLDDEIARLMAQMGPVGEGSPALAPAGETGAAPPAD